MILKLFISKEMFEALDKKYSVTNIICLYQLFCNYQAISTKKNVTIIEKYEKMLNFNAEICIQKPELTFQDKHLINFFVTSLSSTYGRIIDNLNMRDTLTLDGAVCAFCTKKPSLSMRGSLKRKVYILLLKKGYVEVKKAKK